MASPPISGSDHIVLNVGGVRFETLRSTLCKYNDSMLAAMFSGRHAKPLPMDQDGIYFLDRDPVLFRIVLLFLRQVVPSCARGRHAFCCGRLLWRLLRECFRFSAALKLSECIQLFGESGGRGRGG